MDLIIDIILKIIDLLPIPDTRNLLRCSKKLHLLSSNKIILLPINKNSLNWQNKLIFDLSKYKSKSEMFNLFPRIEEEKFSELEKYIFELICCGYMHLLPTRYLSLYILWRYNEW